MFVIFWTYNLLMVGGRHHLNNKFIWKNQVGKMSNLSSEYDNNFSGEESPEVVPAGKYIKKMKSYKKKGHKLISSTLKKKRCELYNVGSCTKGSLCMSSHSFIPDVAKKICKSFLSKSCLRGEECPYSHNVKRYPCKFFHLEGSCSAGTNCRFSHNQIDQENQEQFFKDNQEYLIKLNRQGKNLSEKILNYIIENDLLNPNRKIIDQTSSKNTQIPFLFSFPLVRTVSKEQVRVELEKSNYKKVNNVKKQSISENPFSIRMVYKNRFEIPEKIPLQSEEKALSLFQRPVNSSSSSRKNELQGLESNKFSQRVELTPDSQLNKVQPEIEEYVCSYY